MYKHNSKRQTSLNFFFISF